MNGVLNFSIPLASYSDQVHGRCWSAQHLSPEPGMPTSRSALCDRQVGASSSSKGLHHICTVLLGAARPAYRPSDLA